MPYANISQLPPTFNRLPSEAKRVAMRVINDRLKAGASDQSAIKQAWTAVKNGWKKAGENWVKKQSIDEFSLDTAELRDVEIFAVGKWNGGNYTEQDLCDIVNNFNALKEEVKPYIKLGHDDNQKLLQSDGYPAAGWITKLKIRGKKLLADICGIPKKISELIEAGGYRRVSSEIFVNFKDRLGQNYNKVLKAVSLLGADTPAVVTLDDLVAQYDLDQDYEQYTFEVQGGEIMEGEKQDIKNLENKEADDMVGKKVFPETAEKAAPDEVAAKAEDAEVKDMPAEEKKEESEVKEGAPKEEAPKEEVKEKAPAEEVKISDTPEVPAEAPTESTPEVKNNILEFKKQISSLKAENEKMKKEKKEQGITEFTQKLLADQKIVPKQSPYVKTILRSLDETEILTYTDGDKKKEMSVVEAFKRLMEANVEGKLLGEVSVGETATFTRLEDAIEAEMKVDKKLSYSKATILASQKFPQLVEEPKNI